ncbi:pirin family protein [Algibacter mikhailovii]|uniref:pirin family protein n=1 Tax=Algibacter mikhailovii TaxID=425498 RepID=UPI0024943B87|nr:pirin family protein [Algibacter mikhailovii]
MKTVIHRADSRGYADHGWLKSYHSFSFAGYQNIERMNFGKLRVLNDDLVQPKMGFGTHPHQNMEIISIPLQGALSHKDSMGNKRAIEVGEVQVMTAGTGLTHSEFNDSNTDAVNFLQLWIIPESMDVKPNYEQHKFNNIDRYNKLQMVVAPKDNIEHDALPINQQAYIYRTRLDSGHALDLKPKNADNGFYLFIVEGSLTVSENLLEKRDSIGVWDVENMTILANDTAEVIIIEVPMH